MLGGSECSGREHDIVRKTIPACKNAEVRPDVRLFLWIQPGEFYFWDNARTSCGRLLRRQK